MSQMVDIPVNDIAPLAEVHDYSIYLFGGSVTIGVVITLSLILFVLKKWRGRRLSERKYLYHLLDSIDLSDSKRAAYKISELGRVFASDNERTERAYHNLFERLEPYKYAPVVEPFTEEVLGYYRLYLEIIDV
jgi:HAMP domain-containing protein